MNEPSHMHCDRLPTRVKPITVSGIGQYLPVSVGIGIGRYTDKM